MYRRLLPGYVRRFVDKATALLDLRIDGDLESTFRLVPVCNPRALDPLLSSLEAYAEGNQDRLTVYRPDRTTDGVWMHPGEAVFDSLSASVVGRFGNEGLKGAVFVDPYATQPYLFHMALVSVEQVQGSQAVPGAASLTEASQSTLPKAGLVESRLVGLRQTGDGSVEEAPVEHLLLLKGAGNFVLGSEPLALAARTLVHEAKEFAEDIVTGGMVQAHRKRIIDDLDDRMGFVGRGFDYQAAELTAARSRLNERSQAGDHRVREELARVRERQRSLAAARERRLDEMRDEPNRIRPGEVELLVHALVVLSQDSEGTEQYDADVEAIAVEVATAYEKRFNAQVSDVSRPELARRAGLTDWPGFDLLSRRTPAADRLPEELAIEVKGRRGYGGIEMKDNEWANACNLRGKYWLYVVFDCATAHPRLVPGTRPLWQAAGKDAGIYGVHNTGIADSGGCGVTSDITITPSQDGTGNLVNNPPTVTF